ncbi:MAG: chorismate synthase [Ruminococcaceae bacterium]|nr:chorismate synthase [Oscillospiraceae bacterium]
MLASYGNNLKLYIEGGSHDEKIEMFLDGFPADFNIDEEELYALMKRRAPGTNKWSTPRKEKDMPVFLSGVNNNITTGERIHAAIYSNNQHSSDYSFIYDTPRPSHADYAALVKYGNRVDLRGGGHFSGRLTSLMCVAGGICLQYLKQQGINVYAHIYSIAGEKDVGIDSVKVDEEAVNHIKEKEFPVIDDAAGQKMKAVIQSAREEGDSVGGVVECCATGLPVGLGEHMFAGVEGRMASILYSIPAVKAVEFGNGFDCTLLKGSENNDPYYYDDGIVRTRTNNCGGIVGGMTNGMPVLFKVAFKPTPSIAKEQDTVSLVNKENTKLAIKGRHDPCIVPRAVPVVEAAAAIALCDMLLDK